MARINFVPHRFSGKIGKIVEKAGSIIDNYREKGYNLTLRQLHYRLCSYDYGIDYKNDEASYKKLSEYISDARLSGAIDIDALEDRTRYPRSNSHWNDPEHFLSSAIKQYSIDTRRTQPNYLEIWVEKDALIEIFEKTAQKLDVTCMSCRGFCSVSQIRDSVKRFSQAKNKGQKSYILYFGDHDASGLEIPEAIKSRLKVFKCDAKLLRIGLTLDQIKQYDLPPSPQKISDKRAAKYIQKHGKNCWELDALDPGVLEHLIHNNVMSLTDIPAWDAEKEMLSRQRQALYDLKNIITDVVKDIKS